MEKSDSKVSYAKVTKENIKEGMEVRVAPSANLIRVAVDGIASQGISGFVTKENGKFIINVGFNIVAEADDFFEQEKVFAEIKKDEKEENNTKLD